LEVQIVDAPLRILILEDNPSDAEITQYELQEAGIAFTAKVVTGEHDFVRELRAFSPDIILSDYDLPRYDGAAALAEVKKQRPEVPFILVTGAVTEERAIEMLTSGAKDYVMKNRLTRLVPAIKRVLAEAEEVRARNEAEDKLRRAYAELEVKVKERTAALEAEIEQRKRAEETLRESEERLSSVLDGARDAIARLNLQTGRYAYFSRASEEVYGFTPAEMMAMSYDEAPERVHPDDRAVLAAARLQAGEIGSAQYDIRWRLKSGKYRWLSISISDTRDAKGRPLHRDGIARDINDRKAAEEALRESEERFRTIFEGNTDGMLIADPRTKAFVMGNPSICRMLGCRSEEISTMQLGDIHRQEDMSFVLDHFERLVSGRESTGEDIPVKKKDGSMFFADITANPITLSGKTYIVGSFRKIAQRNRL
jgi:PAS domain S-box-containing protein